MSVLFDWEVAGFFPRGWIRTKFRISSGLDLNSWIQKVPDPVMNGSFAKEHQNHPWPQEHYLMP
ncbi:hypothetical protein PITC_060560 [Penicillium italicum]|uniref:Uncharacterized protein n=1 Tax=Penicillium italicum TaxID=40296 RepID=A0A0A2LNI8_PENIT|nr:hypothetical protein PITC_060560 [Penicillium italicum]